MIDWQRLIEANKDKIIKSLEEAMKEAVNSDCTLYRVELDMDGDSHVYEMTESGWVSEDVFRNMAIVVKVFDYQGFCWFDWDDFEYSIIQNWCNLNNKQHILEGYDNHAEVDWNESLTDYMAYAYNNDYNACIDYAQEAGRREFLNGHLKEDCLKIYENLLKSIEEDNNIPLVN